MIESSEQWWSRALGRGARVLVVAPHPDDETIGCGGLLARATAHGAAVRILIVTDGENNAWAQRAVERRWHVGDGDRARWGARRRAEALAATDALGVDRAAVQFLGLPDQGLTDLLLAGGGALIERLDAELAAFDPTLVVAPHLDDRHPDHSALAVLLALAGERRRPAVRRDRLAYVIHGPIPDVGRVSLSLDAIARARKQRAICAHTSQLAALRRRVVGLPRREVFLTPTPRRAHPVRDVAVDATTIRLDLATPRLRIPLRASWLHVVAHGAGPVITCSLRLPARDGRSLVVRGRDAGPGRDTVSVRRALGRAHVVLPRRLFGPAHRLFVKVERRGLFFDAAGWGAVSIGTAAVGTAAPLGWPRAVGETARP